MHLLVSRFTLTPLVVLGLLAPPVQAQDDGWITQWSHGFKVESKDGQHKFKFGGRIQADYTFASGDDALESDLKSGFEFRRARLFFSGTVYERIAFNVQYDFAGGDAEFKDFWIGLKVGWGQAHFGHFKEYFSLEEQTSSKYLAFLERSLPVEAFSPNRNSGVGVHGSRGDTLNWGIGYFLDTEDFAISANEDNTNLTGRIGWRPLYEEGGKRLLHLAIAASAKEISETSQFRIRSRPEAHLTTRFVNTGRFAADSATLWGAEVAGVFGRFWFAGEYIQYGVDSPAFGDPTFDGYYAQAGFFLSEDHRRFKTSVGAFDRLKPSRNWDKSGGKGAWEVAIRASSLNLSDAGISGGQQDNLTLAVNGYLNPAARLMINWVHADIDTLGDASFFLVRWQVDF